MIEVNRIKEIYKGHYQVILDFPDPNDLIKILDISCKYVWGIEHHEARTEWIKYNFSLYGKLVKPQSIQARNMEMEYLVETPYFMELIPNINQTIHIIQTNIIPPYYLNFKLLPEKTKYDLLKSEIDYLFELEMSGAIDYAPLISPSIDFLERVIKQFEMKDESEKRNNDL